MPVTAASKPILITGAHRSGTTWVGRNLALAPRTGYIHEPFNIYLKFGYLSPPFPNQFQFIGEANGQQFEEGVRRVVRFEYPLWQNLALARKPRDVAKVLKYYSISQWHRLREDRPIIKDPLAIFSAEWLAAKFDMKVLVMIRHPAAFCSSLKLKGWKFSFSAWLNQPLLMEKYLSDFRTEIADFAAHDRDLIDQAILLWNCIYHTVSLYRREHPDWLFVRHEDLSRDPLGGFQSIFQAFGLEFTAKARAIIRRNSGEHNPAEQIPKNEFIRNSKANIYNWKKRLTTAEIAKIKAGTAAIAGLFYNDEEW